jgi:transposase
MRQAHLGGDKPFVDYAGDTVPVIVDRFTGQVRPVQIFVAVMGRLQFHLCRGELDPGAG